MITAKKTNANLISSFRCHSCEYSTNQNHCTLNIFESNEITQISTKSSQRTRHLLKSSSAIFFSGVFRQLSLLSNANGGGGGHGVVGPCPDMKLQLVYSVSVHDLQIQGPFCGSNVVRVESVYHANTPHFEVLPQFDSYITTLGSSW